MEYVSLEQVHVHISKAVPVRKPPRRADPINAVLFLKLKINRANLYFVLGWRNW